MQNVTKKPESRKSLGPLVLYEALKLETPPLNVK